jgi:IclR family transcriptional regulator, KDG regulon repressor
LPALEFRVRDMARAAGPQAPDGVVQSVSTAIDVLECLMREEEVGVSDVARRLGVAKSTAHRLLTTLCSRGLAERNPDTGRYRLGMRLFELGQMASDRYPLRRAALPLLEELRQASGLTVHLTVADGADVVFVERLHTLAGIRLMAAAGRRQPVHVTSAGKALAAFDPAVAQARRLAGFPRMTERTIVTAADWERVLAEVRREGIAVSIGEARPQLTSVAAPVRNSYGRAFAAVSVAGPSPEFGDFGRAARLVLTASAKLAHSLAVR